MLEAGKGARFTHTVLNEKLLHRLEPLLGSDEVYVPL